MTPFTCRTPLVRSFSFPDDGRRINGGCAVIVARGRQQECLPMVNPDESDDFHWDDAQTAAFLAGEPLTLGWVSPSTTQSDGARAHVFCWITIESD